MSEFFKAVPCDKLSQMKFRLLDSRRQQPGTAGYWRCQWQHNNVTPSECHRHITLLCPVSVSRRSS